MERSDIRGNFPGFRFRSIRATSFFWNYDDNHPRLNVDGRHACVGEWHHYFAAASGNFEYRAGAEIVHRDDIAHLGTFASYRAQPNEIGVIELVGLR
jgi:hypothetical protein